MSVADHELALVRERVAMLLPLVATFVAWWLPVFDVVVVSDATGALADTGEDVALVGRSTLVGAVFDAEASPGLLVRLAAVAVIALLGAVVLLSLAWIDSRRHRVGTAVDVVALLALLAVVVLWFAVRADDSRTEGLGLEPTMQFLALLVAAAAYPLARGRTHR